MIKKMMSLILSMSSILLFLIPSAANADFVWSVPETDTSYQFLAFFFGNVSSDLTCPLGSSLGCSALVPMLFSLLNQGVLAVGVFVMSYVMLYSTANTAHDGAFMGERGASIWTPIKLTIGTGFLVPGSSGYSTLQMYIIKVVLIGVALANNIYGTLRGYVEGNDITFGKEQVDPTDMDSLISSVTNISSAIFPLQSCYAYYQRISLIAQTTGSQSTPDNYYLKPPLGSSVSEFNGSPPTLSGPAYYDCYVYSNTNEIKSHFFSYYYITDEQKALFDQGTTVCDWPNPTNDNKEIKPSNSSTITWNGIDKGYNICGYFQYNFEPTDDLQETTQIALNTLELNLYDAAVDLVDKYQAGLLPLPPTDPSTSNKNVVEDVQEKIVNAIGIAYQQILQGAQNQTREAAEDYSEENADTNDWMDFPYNFHKWLQKGQNLAVDVPLSIPTVTMGTIDQNPRLESGSLKDSLYYQFQQDIKALDLFNQTYINDELTSDSSFTLDSPTDHHKIGPTTYLYQALKKMVSNGEEPLFSLASYGLGILKIAFDTVIISMMIGLTVMGVAGALASCQSSYAGALVSAGGSLLNTMLIALTFLMPLGIALGIYLPLMPVMTYALGALGWFAQVIESMVAGPVIALGMMAPSQDSLGKAQPSIVMMFNVMLRPSLMVIGVVFGAKAFDIFAIYFSNVMVQSFSAVSDIGHFGGWSGLVFIVFWYFYGLGIIVVAQQCYGLIHQVPDKVLTWIGDQTGSLTSGQELDQMREGLNKGGEVLKKETTNLSKGITGMSEDVAKFFSKKNKGDDSGA